MYILKLVHPFNRRSTDKRNHWTLSEMLPTLCSWTLIRSALYQAVSSPEALYEMSVKYQQHQFPLTIILPQSSISHMSSNEAQQTEQATAGVQILRRSFSTLERRDCWAEISDTDTASESLHFMVNYQSDRKSGFNSGARRDSSLWAR